MNAMAELIVLCPAEDVPEGGIRAQQLPDGTAIALYKVDGQIYATDDTCTHGAASLSEDGVLDGCEVECSWHFGRFDVRTGNPCGSPCSIPLKTYSVMVVDGMIQVEI